MEVEEAKSEESTTAVQHLPEIGGVGIRRDYLRHSAWTKAVLRYCSLGFQDAGAGEDPGSFNYRDLLWRVILTFFQKTNSAGQMLVVL
jgi:hypothetical protein